MAYTNISKPTGSTYTSVAKPTNGGGGDIKAGMTTGLLIPLTYATAHSGAGSSGYTNVSKPTGATYTDVAKPTT